MRNTRALTITLPHDMASMVKSKVSSGEYATESEVIRDGLRALQARDSALEAWLRDEVAKSYQEVADDPESAIPVDQVLTRIQQSYRARVAKSRA